MTACGGDRRKVLYDGRSLVAWAPRVADRIAQHWQDVMFEPRVSGLDVVKNHHEIVAYGHIP